MSEPNNLDPMLPGGGADLMRLGRAMQVAMEQKVWAVNCRWREPFRIGALGVPPADEWIIVSSPGVASRRPLHESLWQGDTHVGDVYRGTSVEMFASQLAQVVAPDVAGALLAYAAMLSGG